LFNQTGSSNSTNTNGSSNSTNNTDSSANQNITLRFLNETEAESAEETAGKFLNINKDNLVSEIILGVIAFVLVLIIIVAVLCCIRYLYIRLPKALKSLIMTIKAKLMWSSVLRVMSQKYLDQSILCMMSLQQYYALDPQQRIITPLTLVYLVSMPALTCLILYRNRKTLHT